MTVAARPQRSIPTIPVSPELLREDDMVWPDIAFKGNPFRLLARPHRVKTSNGTMGWQLNLEGHGILLVRDHAKVRAQRRPNPGPPSPDEAWQALENYPEPRYV